MGGIKMKHVITLKLLFTFIILFGTIIVKAQTDTTTLNSNLLSSIEEEHPTIINTKMIERFNRNYNDIEVIPWFDIFSEKSFEEVRTYLAAYKNIELDKVPSSEVYKYLSQKKQELENYTANKKPIYQNHSSID